MKKKKIGALLALAILTTNTPIIYPQLTYAYTKEQYIELKNLDGSIFGLAVIDFPEEIVDGQTFDLEIIINADLAGLNDGHADNAGVDISLNGASITKSGNVLYPLNFDNRNEQGVTNYHFYLIDNEYTYQEDDTVEVNFTFRESSNIKSSYKGEINLNGKKGPSTATVSEGLKISTNIINAVVGENQQIAITLENTADAKIESGELTIELDDEDHSDGIKINRDEISFPSIRAGQTITVYTTLNIDEDVTRGIHNLIISANDEDNVSAIVPVKVDSNFTPASFEITTENTTNFEEDTPKQININFKNIGQISAKNVKVELIQTNSVYIMDGSNVKYLDNIEPHTSQNLGVLIQVNDVEDSSNIPLQLKISYIDDLGKTQEDTQYIYLTTLKKDVDKAEITIDNIVEPSQTLLTDTPFNVSFDVFAPDELENVKINVIAPEGIIPKSKNLFNVVTGAQNNYSVTFQALDTTETSTYPIEIKADYTLNDELVTYSQYATVSIENEEEAKKSEIIINNIVGPSGTLTSDDTFNVSFDVFAPDGAEKVKVNVISPEGIIPKSQNLFTINEIAKGATNHYNVTFQALDTVETSTYPIEIKAEYNLNDEDIIYSQYSTVNIENQDELKKAEITIDKIVEPKGILLADVPFNISFNVSAPDGAENVKVSVISPEKIVPKSKNLFVINKLAAGASNKYVVTFQALDTITTSTYPIEIKAEYNLNDEDITYSQYATVSVENEVKDDEDENKGGTPKVIIGEYKIDPVVVQAGEEFSLDIGFFNTHKDKTVSNFKANLTITEQGEDNTGSVFTPVGGSNTFYIDEMDPGETVYKTIRMYTIPSADPKTYELTMKMEYEDEDGDPISASEFLGIPVEQVTKLDVADISVEQIEVGMEGDLTAQIFNKGKTIISNVEITTTSIDENFDIFDNKQIVGKLEIGAVEYYEPTIIANEAGMLKGQINVEYEDVTGKIHNIVEEFDFEVMEAYVEEDFFPEEEFFPEPELEEEPEEEKVDVKPQLVGIFFGFSISALITKFLYARKKKKLMALGEDDED
ncbi:hypothetical protein AN642_01140 [Epulopiscium sp. SCG-B10WGA-EpuloA2]|nr:hypothetical protein AN642_01140 [Epulopiscium sp. SCG-B10WGA-EpuloA2]